VSDPARRTRLIVAFGVLAALVVVALAASLALGSVSYSPGTVINALFRPDEVDRGAFNVVRKVRLPRTAAAGLSGAALAICGAQMQTIFRNPLADPFVMGVTSGAAFGVAIVVLAAGTGASTWIGGLDMLGDVGISGAAFVGAIGVTFVALAASRRVHGTASILIVGLMIGYLLAALVSLIVAHADPIRLKQFSTWGFGSFRAVSNDELRILGPAVGTGLVLSFLSCKSLNALLLGERYAESMGIAVRRDRFLILLVASLLAGVVTAFAGPVAFIGVASPHLARPLVRTSDHRALLPAAAAIGVVMALVAEIVSQTPGQDGILPLNAVTAILGVPVVIWVLTRRSRVEVVT
jgi:iron complex transport system permease protein